MYRKLAVLIAFSAITLFLLAFSLTPQGAQAGSPNRHGKSKIGLPLVDGLILESAASRKSHNGTPYDIDMPINATLSGSNSGIESRLGLCAVERIEASNNTGQDYARQVLGGVSGGCFLIVLTFNNTVTAADDAEVTAHNPLGGTGIAETPTFVGNEMRVPLTGVSNAQVLTLSVTNVTDGTNPPISFDVNIGFLIGDTTSNRTVNSSDISQTKSLSGTAPTSTTARVDVIESGQIDATDISAVKAASGTAVP
jgi:hypothetical protein